MRSILTDVFQPVDGDIQLAITLNPDQRKIIECMLRWGSSRFQDGKERERIEWVETVGNLEMNWGDVTKRLEQATELLQHAVNQIEYLHGKFQPTGSGNNVLARIESFLSASNPQP